MIEIEIKGHYGQFIKGYLQRVVEDKGAIVYADDPSSEELIPLSELRLPPAEGFDALSLSPQLHVEALLPVSVQENPQDNSFTEALSSLRIPQTIQHPSVSSRLANPFACLNCPSWWPCVVTKVRDAHAVVQLRPVLPVTDESASPPPREYTELATNLSAMTEICERKMLRPATPPDAPTLSPDTLFTHKINLSQDLLPYASDLAVHEIIPRHCGGPISLYLENDHLVVLSPSLEVIRVVRLLEEMHLRMLRQKCYIIRYINQMKKFHDSPGTFKDGVITGNGADDNAWSLGEEGLFVETFSVPSPLMGLAIGAQGANIRSARSITGVVRINVRAGMIQRNGASSSSSTAVPSADSDDQLASNSVVKPSFADQSLAHFQVFAETAEAAKAARAALEFCQVCLQVPKRLIGRVLGIRSSNINAICEKSGIRYIRFESDPKVLPKPSDAESISNDRTPTCVNIKDKHPELASAMERDAVSGFFLIGLRDAVEKARLLITFQVECIFDLEKLETEKLSLLRELPGRSSGPSHGGLPHEANNQENDGLHRGGPRGGGGGPRDPLPPRSVAAGDPHHEAPRGGNQQPLNPVGDGGGRRAGRQPPRSSGDFSGSHRGCASPRHEAYSATVNVTADEKTSEEAAPMAGRRRGGGAGSGISNSQRGGNRQRNRVGPHGGSGGGSAGPMEKITDELNGFATAASGFDRSNVKKEIRNEGSAAVQQNGKRHPVNSTTEVGNPL